MTATKLTEWERVHRARLRAYQRQVEKLYDTLATEAARLASQIGPLGGKPFMWADYPLTRQQMERITGRFESDLETIVTNGVRAEWQLSEDKNDQIVTDLLAARDPATLTQAQRRSLFTPRPGALDAFLKRKTAGMTLSRRVWDLTRQNQQELELAIDAALRDGTPSESVATGLKRYLRYPDKLFRRVRDDHGQLRLSQAARAFHPGQGVYRSSFMNARRLAVTETNMAYHTADYTRWQTMGCVVGIEIKLSNNHNCKGYKPGTFADICDTLQGRYPKEFKFTGWHPHCRCQALPILMTPDEFLAQIDGRPVESANAVRQLPRQYTAWTEANAPRIERARERGTLAYFIRDNERLTQSAGTRPTITERARQRHAKRTDAEVESIKHTWERFKTYLRYKTDPDYNPVRFDYHTGGLMATHKGHNLDKKKGWYEIAVQKAGYKAGHSVILESENHTRYHIKNTEGTWDGHKFEVAAAETAMPNNIRNALKHCASKPDCEVAVIFLPNGYVDDAMREGYAKYNGLKNTTQWRPFKEIYIIGKDEGDIKHLPPLS